MYREDMPRLLDFETAAKDYLGGIGEGMVWEGTERHTTLQRFLQLLEEHSRHCPGSPSSLLGSRFQWTILGPYGTAPYIPMQVAPWKMETTSPRA
jgi:hypothetical protein